MSKEDLVNGNTRNGGTGSNFISEFRMVVYPFEMYEIVVKLALDGKFVGIEEVRIRKDFRSYKNKTPQRIFAQIDEFPSE
jgi:hypothetical protein